MKVYYKNPYDKMGEKILINVDYKETRVAIIEDSTLSEIYIEKRTDKQIAGNIYKGRVVKILPGMDAAFVDIGLKKAGFLYVSEVFQGELIEEFSEFLEDGDIYGKPPKGVPIEDLLKEGQEIIVQVVKEPIGNKGPRLSSHITLAGRYLILMPTMTHIGISRRITDPQERKRLKDIVEKIRPMPFGFIVRTVSEGKTETELTYDMEYLIRLWNSIKKKAENTTAPRLIYADPELPLRVIRDFVTSNTQALIIDDEEGYKKAVEFAKEYVPFFASKIELYNGLMPLFSYYGIEDEIKKALEKKIWLRSGGYIVIEETEALTAIDVNTGKFVGHKNLEDTIFHINMEAAKEIAHQIRLRNIGGIIIIDFIDMHDEYHKEEVLRVLKEALKKDRYPSHIQGFSELGLVIMTRKRVKESLLKTLCESCHYCNGKGFVKPADVVTSEIFREIKKAKAKKPTANMVLVEANPQVAKYLIEEAADVIEDIEGKLNLKIRVAETKELHQERFRVRAFNA